MSDLDNISKYFHNHIPNTKFGELACGQVGKGKLLEVEIIFNEITKSLAEGRRVELRGFGAVAVQHRKERVGRNPKDMKEYI